MFVHLSWDHICVELADEASWAVILDNLNHTLLNFLVLDNFFFECVSIKPLYLSFLRSLFSDEMMRVLIIHKLFDKLVKLLFRGWNLEDKSLILFVIEVVVFDGEVLCHTVEWFNCLLWLWIDDIELRDLVWHGLDVEEFLCFVFILAIVDVKHFIVVS